MDGGRDAGIATEAVVAPADETGPVGTAWYPGGEAARLVGDFQAGKLSLHDLACAFGGRTWPAVTARLARSTGLRMRCGRRPRASHGGTFDDVVRAYDRGAITAAHYAVLAQAAAHIRQ